MPEIDLEKKDFYEILEVEKTAPPGLIYESFINLISWAAPNNVIFACG